MFKFIYTLLALHFVFFSNPANAQAPGGLNYQGVARNQYLVGLNNKTITLRFSIRENTVAGTVLYSETRNAQTDSFGVFSVVIGADGATSQTGLINQVPWSNATKKFLQVELDINTLPSTGFLNMGTTELLSVPYSFFSTGSGSYFFSATVDPLAYESVPVSIGSYPYTFPVVFSVVLFNEGNGYNPTTGEFTASEDGFYEFGVNINKRMVTYDQFPQGISMGFALTKNLAIIRKFDGYNESYGSVDLYKFDGFESKVTLKLAQGDKVGLRMFNGSIIPIYLGLGPNPLYSLFADAQPFAEFSGHKIK